MKTEAGKKPIDILQSLISVATMDPQSSIFQKLNKQLLSAICFDLIRSGIVAELRLYWNKVETLLQWSLGHEANGNTFKTLTKKNEQKLKHQKPLII